MNRIESVFVGQNFKGPGTSELLPQMIIAQEQVDMASAGTGDHRPGRLRVPG